MAFRRYTLLPLDDCLYALQPTIPHLTRSSLHRCLQRHGIGRLPDVEGDKPAKKKFKAYPIGFFHIDIAEFRTEQGKLHMFVAIDRTTSKFAFVELHEKAPTAISKEFLLRRERDWEMRAGNRRTSRSQAQEGLLLPELPRTAPHAEKALAAPGSPVRRQHGCPPAIEAAREDHSVSSRFFASVIVGMLITH